MKPLFSLHNFSFFFDKTKAAFFQNVSFEILKPGLTFILGKNGVGKSTFFKSLQGLVRNNEHMTGFVVVHDTRYDMNSQLDLQRLYFKSMILQQNFDAMLSPHFTGYENLYYSQFVQNPGFEKIKVPQMVSKEVEYFDLPLQKPVYQLSGGQRQMLALSMVLQKPLDIVLLDEPTAALDDKNSHYVMQKIQKLALEQNKIIFCISHDMHLIQEYANNRVEIIQNEQGQREFFVQ
jgi:energy-coupling factor transporter ATP-binding protein EcfA2